MQPKSNEPNDAPKHRQGNRTNPKQSTQITIPVQSTSPSKQSNDISHIKQIKPTNQIKQIKHADNWSFNKTNHMGLDWMRVITLGCMGLPWMGFACVAWLSAWSWVGSIYWTRFDSVCLHWIVLDMLRVALTWIIDVFHFICLDFTWLDLVFN